jgi:small GTP-binding protein
MVVPGNMLFSASAETVIVLGSAGAGKTSLVEKYLANEFSTDYHQTFGADLYEKTATDPSKVTMNFWVVGGHERYRTLLNQFYNVSVGEINSRLR